MDPKYKRVLLKLSGEALSAKDGIIDGEFLMKVCGAVKRCTDMGVQVALVLGGGNIWRGRIGISVKRSRSDGMGMLATLINSIAVQDALIKCGADAHVFSPIEVQRLTESYSPDAAIRCMENGGVAIIACGTANPYFSTDTGAMLRALETEADVLMCAKNIDGIYDSDPKQNPKAKRYATLTYGEMLAKGLKAVDSTAACMGNENGMKMLVFALEDPENICRVAAGEELGTVVLPD